MKSMKIKSTGNLVVLLPLSLLVLAIGTIGYMLIEGWSLFEAFYMTIITVTTVGYGEVHELSFAGRVFTAVLIFTGAGFVLFVTGSVVQFMADGRIREIWWRKKVDKQINKLKDHYIVCGYGRIGRVLVSHLRESPLDIVVIEQNPELIPVMEQDEILYISACATEETALLRAGIKRAKALISVLATDTDNVFLVLTARQLNPEVYIMARASAESAKNKLLAAGANKIESPYDIGAASMARRVVRPTVTDFLDLVLARKHKDIQMEEFPVAATSSLCGQTIRDSQIRQKFDIIIIAIKKFDNTMIFNPSPDESFKATDTVVVVGDDKSLLTFSQAVMDTKEA